MPPENTQIPAQKSGSSLMAIVAVLIIAVLGFLGYRVMKKPADEMAMDTPTPSPAVPTEPVPAGASGTRPVGQKYMDGTYTAEGSYPIPNGAREKMNVTVVLANGVVTDVHYTSNPKEKGSIANQAKFNAGYKAEVVGKPIDEIALTVVNGSSLTPIGFMDALEKIKAEASSPEATVAI